MDTLSLTALRYPFPDLVNPQVDEMENYALQVIDAYTDIDETLKQQLRQSSIGGLIARFFPLAGPEYVHTIVRYLVVAFVFEDTYTRLPVQVLQPKCERAAAVLENGTIQPGDEMVLQQLQCCMEEAHALHATPVWLRRFAQDNKDFLQSLLTETTFYSNYTAIRYPTLQECMAYRVHQIDFYPFFDYLELTMQFVFPQEVYLHPFIQRLRLLAAHFIVYVNDLYSIQKDVYNKEIMNVVLVMQQQEQCSLENAQQRALQLHDAELEEFMQLCASPPDFGQYNELIGRYVYQLQLMVQGNLSWHKVCRRYRDYE